MTFVLKLYRVSADNGETWTEQWLTENEAQESIEKYGMICELIGGEKKIFLVNNKS